MTVHISLDDAIGEAEVLALYQANQWSSADKPQQLLAALRNSHSLVTARRDGRLLGLGNAISDGHLVVYYPHMLVHPDVQGQGIGRLLLNRRITLCLQGLIKHGFQQLRHLALIHIAAHRTHDRSSSLHHRR